MIPAGFGQQIAQGQAVGLGAGFRPEVVLLFQHALEVADQAFQFLLRGRGEQVFGGRLCQIRMLAPFIGAQDHGLGKIERCELRIDRYGQDGAGQCNVLGLQPRSFGPENVSGAARGGLARRVDLACGFLRRDDRLGHTALAHGRGIDVGAVGNGFSKALEDLRLFQHHVGARCGRACRGIGPAVAGGDEAHFSEPEVEHRPGRLADILAKLRPDVFSVIADLVRGHVL